MSERSVPFHCPYCGDENLRPGEEGHGSWECHACLRAFSLRMLGMIPRGGSAVVVPASGDDRTEEVGR
jgi:transposase-like protein